MSDEVLLELENVSVRYGARRALESINLEVEEGEIVALLGAKGAGKSTTLRAISGLVPAKGSIRFAGEEISGRAPHEVVAAGVGQVPEGRRIFAQMSVRENLEMGAYQRRDVSEADFTRVYELFPVLRERERQEGGALSGGEQQMLAIGRALMARPRLLLLDEPSLGLAPLYVARILAIIKEIREAGTTVLLVEQNAAAALRLADRGYVLETGSVVMAGPAAALLADARVRAAYLGQGAA
jgi:branched-chain amino acid transport system ATP-binding protein